MDSHKHCFDVGYPHYVMQCGQRSPHDNNDCNDYNDYNDYNDPTTNDTTTPRYCWLHPLRNKCRGIRFESCRPFL